MRHLLIIAAAGSACMGDEIITTFGDGWELAFGWKAIGQTMTVPESNMLESFLFVGQEWNNGDVDYMISVYDWDEASQHVAGEARWQEWAELPDEPGLRLHDIDLLLERGTKIAVIIEIDPAETDFGGVGFVQGSNYDEGAFISTEGSINELWSITEGDVFDLYFTATFRSCKADIYNDGHLNIFDFLAFQALFTSGDMKADFNGDGMLNVLDFVAFQAAFQGGCGAE